MCPPIPRQSAKIIHSRINAIHYPVRGADNQRADSGDYTEVLADSISVAVMRLDK
jgi:hypothetical protein